MSKTIFVFSDDSASKSKEEQSKILDEELEEFSKYMETLGDFRTMGPLSRPEHAIVKTYMIYKLKQASKS